VQAQAGEPAVELGDEVELEAGDERLGLSDDLRAEDLLLHCARHARLESTSHDQVQGLEAEEAGLLGGQVLEVLGQVLLGVAQLPDAVVEQGGRLQGDGGL